MAKVLCDFRFLLLIAAGIFIYIQMRLFATQSGYADRLAAAIEDENHCTSQMRSLIDQISLQQGRIVALEASSLFAIPALVGKAVLPNNYSASFKVRGRRFRMESNGIMTQSVVFLAENLDTSSKEERKRRDQECGQMKSLVQDLETYFNKLKSRDDNREGVGLIIPVPCLQSKVSYFIGKDLQRLTDKMQVPVAAVVIIACNRADYLERTINSVLKHQRPISSRFPLFVSQDGSNPDVKSTAFSYDQLSYMQHLDFEPVQTERPGELIAYYKIARHYKWALDELFYKHNFSRVIILEDDMDIAPDFFDYFEAAATLLDKDKSIMAVSSWNDNGQKQFVHDPCVNPFSLTPTPETVTPSLVNECVDPLTRDELYRSDFFPGLGWMLARSIWDELSPKWPRAYP
ncbi:hypothetical protein V8G54_007453 [Vigna mungo]|uniref:Alpha-1,3-mannosyl-glycoprotein 2-beta-N-acetylglucosaminyltransferase n=1 Tax=Vigna mungo TaxID=3915 RepID=A0AAQ3S8Z1_VIGMU